MNSDTPSTPPPTAPTTPPSTPAAPQAHAPMPPEAPLPPPPDENDMKRAFAAFKKRIKALQLETDSKLGRQHTTGKKETITAIQPPLGFGKEMWEHLARIGWLKYEGRGFYQFLKKD